MAPKAEKQPAVAKIASIISDFAPRFNTLSGSAVTSIDFDDSGELCLVAQDDETLHIFNCTAGKHAKELKSQKYGADLARFTHHAQSIIYASTKGDGKLLSSCSTDLADAIRYLSTHDNTYIRYFRGHTAPVTSISLSPASDAFLSGSLDDTVRLWDLRSSSAQGLLKLTTPYLTAFDPSASVMAIACVAAKTVLLYDVRAYDRPPFAEFDVQTAEETLASLGHGGQVGAQWTKLEFSNDGKRLLVATNGSGHFVLDAFEGELLAYLVKPSGTTGRVNPADVGALRAAGRRGGIGQPSTGQGDVCLAPDGRFVIGGSGDSELCVWDLKDTDSGPLPSDKLALQPVHRELGADVKLGTQNKVVAYNPRHNQLATADRALVLWLPEVE